MISCILRLPITRFDEDDWAAIKIPAVTTAGEIIKKIYAFYNTVITRKWLENSLDCRRGINDHRDDVLKKLDHKQPAKRSELLGDTAPADCHVFACSGCVRYEGLRNGRLSLGSCSSLSCRQVLSARGGFCPSDLMWLSFVPIVMTQTLLDT